MPGFTVLKFSTENLVQFENFTFWSSAALSLNFDVGGGATRPLPSDGVVDKLHVDPTFGPRPKVWTRDQNGRSSAKDGAPESLRCGTIQEEVGFNFRFQGCKVTK